MPDLTCTLRTRRTAALLSQSELAERAGVSRQAIHAIEAGRQVPSTALALALARALHCTVEDLFRLDAPNTLRARPAGPPDHRVAIGRVDGTWAAHALTRLGSAADGLVTAHHPDGSVSIEPLADPRALASNVLVAGCAPLLGPLTNRLGRRYHDASATWVPANSARALDLLEQGLVHVAGLHLVDRSVPGGHAAVARRRFPHRDTTLVTLACWRQGLVVAAGNPLDIRTAEDVLRDEVRFAAREPGSGTARLAERLLGQPQPAGPVARDHDEVAQLVQWGVADAGIAIEAAAHARGLGFVPLADERFDLLVPRSRLDDPPVARLLSLLEQPAFRHEAARLPGYDLADTGHAHTVPAAPDAS